MQNSERIWQLIDTKKDDFEALSDRVWGMPEIAYNEYRIGRRAHPHAGAAGLPRHRDVAGIPTAVMGEAGDGGPVIAILGEYDALPGLSQEAGVAETEAHRRATAWAMAAATTCSAPPPCWRRPR